MSNWLITPFIRPRAVGIPGEMAYFTVALPARAASIVLLETNLENKDQQKAEKKNLQQSSAGTAKNADTRNYSSWIDIETATVKNNWVK